MVKLKPLFFSILFTFILFPISFAFAQEESAVDEDVMLYDTTFEDSELNPSIYESELTDTEDLNEISSETALAATIATLGVALLIPLLISLGTYIFTSLALSKTGKELGYKHSWFAWFPILNIIMLMQLGEKSAWWILVPFVGQIMMIIAIMRITERRGYDQLLGLIVLTGIGAYILLYLLAWNPKTVATTQTTPVVESNNITQPTLEDQIQQEAKATLPQEPAEPVETIATE